MPALTGSPEAIAALGTSAQLQLSSVNMFGSTSSSALTTVAVTSAAHSAVATTDNTLVIRLAPG